MLATGRHELIFAKSHSLVNNAVNIVRHFLYGEALQSDLSLLDQQQTQAVSQSSRLEAPSPAAQCQKLAHSRSSKHIC